MQYIALLRGINVGGKRPVKMSVLKTAYEAAGFTNVKHTSIVATCYLKPQKQA
ncbi:MAG: DUF1697 domain-containing protein [Latilactobacillus curvatus]|nr:DUF1697 domain-containing protein [Latilactobacillus curvatus]MCP8870868.1 DUF1697 domain-containing protein [Latilactobacillus curvatus]